MGEGFGVHAVAAECEAGDHVDVPVVCCGGEQVGDAVAGRLFFAAGEEHVNAVEIGLGGGGIEAESLVKGAACVHEVDLAAKAVAGILQLCDAQATPAGGKLGVSGGDTGEQGVGAIKVGA